MNTMKNILKHVYKATLCAVLAGALVSCSEDEIAAQDTVAEDMTTSAQSTSAAVSSISVSGLYTEITGDVPCSTCTYILDSRETTVDGKVVGLKPGSVVCLKEGVQYGTVEFVNMEGTVENPIVIGYCSE